MSGSSSASTANIVAGIVQSGSTVTGAIIGGVQNRRANRENLKLAYLARDDELRQQEIINRQTEKSFALKRRELGMSEKESELNRQERKEQVGYNRLQNAANRWADFLNSQITFDQNRLSPLMKR
jgi:hypothetical protein